ncbi:MAG: DUF11 domain-containing protein [Planctomycetes bacterium]|nr:DUF11 domain-containing protein [Planctomycetota bacterium]
MNRRALLAATLVALTAGGAWAQQVTEIEPRQPFGDRLQKFGRSLFSVSPSGPPQNEQSANGRNSGTTSRGAYSAASKKTTGTGPKVNPPGTVPPSQRRVGTPHVATPLEDTAEPGAAPDQESPDAETPLNSTPRIAGNSSRRSAGTTFEAPKPKAPTQVEKKQAWIGDSADTETSPAAKPVPTVLESTASTPSSRRTPAATTTTSTPPQRLARSQQLAPLTTNDHLAAPPRKTPSVDHASASRPIEQPKTNDRLVMSRKSPNLSVDTVGPRKIAVGKEATYTVSLKNSGESVANDVTVFVSIPAWAEIVDARAPLGTAGVAADQPEAGLQWKLNTLAPQSQQDLTLKIVPRRSQPFDLVVRWTCAPPASQATVEVEEPKLQMAISGPSEVHYGEQQLYKLTVSNPGTGDADDVMIHLLPIHAQDGATATHRVGTLKAGTNTAIEIELTARQAGQLNIRAEVTGDGGLKADAAVAVLVRRAQLAATVAAPKVHYAGTPVAAEIHVTNPGDAPAKGVKVTALLPSGAELVSAGQGGRTDSRSGEVAWTVDYLQPGSEQVLQCKYLLKHTGSNRIEAQVVGDGDLRTVASASTQVLAMADLAMDVSDTPGPIPVGDTVTYTVRVRNRGTKSAEEVEVVAYFSDGLEATQVEGGLHQIEAGNVTFRPIATLAANGETIYKITAKSAKEGNHQMRVELSCKSTGARLTHQLSTLFYAADSAGQ